MALEELLNKDIIVTQKRSSSKLTKKQLGCLKGLGLRGIGSSKKLKCDESIKGMIIKLSHIVEAKQA